MAIVCLGAVIRDYAEKFNQLGYCVKADFVNKEVEIISDDNRILLDGDEAQAFIDRAKELWRLSDKLTVSDGLSAQAALYLKNAA